MQLTELAQGLLPTCQAHLNRLLVALEDTPTSSGLSDAAAVAEILVLGDGIPSAEPLQRIFADAAARWLKSGLLEEFCYARVELLYSAVLLAFTARSGASYCPADMTVMKRLCEGRLIGRSEVPVLTQHLIAAYFKRCGVDVDFGDLGRRDLVRMVDKRALRARSDEYDVMVLLMCAQLLEIERGLTLDRPFLYPQLLLAQTIRSGEHNWLPVLAFLCARSFSLDSNLRSAALTSMLEALPARGELLPLPRATAIDSEYIGRAGRGIRVRSTIALVFSLCTLGGTYAEDRASVLVD